MLAIFILLLTDRNDTKSVIYIPLVNYIFIFSISECFEEMDVPNSEDTLQLIQLMFLVTVLHLKQNTLCT